MDGKHRGDMAFAASVYKGSKTQVQVNQQI
jgi:hypothetical protein